MQVKKEAEVITQENQLAYRKINECLCCGSGEITTYLDLGEQPLANSYHKGETQKTFPLTLKFCGVCYHSQLGAVVSPDQMFRNYLYVSSTTTTLQTHFNNLAEYALNYLGNRPKGVTVCDIACNDGLLLEAFLKHDNVKVLGIDPALNLRKITEAKGLPALPDYWNKDIIKKVQDRFDVITACNVFAHVENVHEFLDTCKKMINHDGVIVIEFPYGLETLMGNQFEQVYAEHVHYFTINSFYKLANTHELVICDIVQTPVHGGSIRFTLKRKKGETSRLVPHLLFKEYNCGILNADFYRRYATTIENNANKMKQSTNYLQERGYKIVGYGASAKSCTMMNAWHIQPDYIVDDNALKHGFLTPGSNVEIKAPEALTLETEKFAIIMFAWNFFSEVIEKIKQLVSPQMYDKIVILEYIPVVEASSLTEYV